ncbi:hypothetical protein HS088_TW21G00394 [Tripterygium wilfordii]|uniref:Uncharacterized protein n=1 Tax=Tripterygium wilfordii TaxID=458696 RepID=A0A7J7C263_TRIWF|nr:hypothetical protein HS088_TW21G00394 [Tripterygium wilfordii]
MARPNPRGIDEPGRRPVQRNSVRSVRVTTRGFVFSSESIVGSLSVEQADTKTAAADHVISATTTTTAATTVVGCTTTE